MYFLKFGGILSLTIIVLLTSVPSNKSSPVQKLSPRLKRHYREICHAGKVYNITSVKDLEDNLADLQCIFRVAEEPSKVPEGPLYGDVHTLGNTQLINPLMRLVWTGKFIEKVECQTNETYLGWNKIFNQPQVPFVAYLGKLPDHDNTHPLYRDNKTSLMIDYRQDMSEVCPDYVTMKGRSFEALPVRKSPVNKVFFPFNIVLDVVRLVGRQEDGGAILLGQMFAMDKFASDKMSKPVLFFSMISYDPELNKEFKHGQPLESLKSDFHYRNQNMLDVMMLTLPVDNLPSEPIHVAKMVALEMISTGRGFGNFIWDACCASGDDSQRFSEVFRSLQPNITSSSNSRSKFISKHEELHSHFNEL